MGERPDRKNRKHLAFLASPLGRVALLRDRRSLSRERLRLSRHLSFTNFALVPARML